MGPALPSPQPGTIPTESVAMPVPAASPTPASPASNRAVTPSNEGKWPSPPCKCSLSLIPGKECAQARAELLAE